MPLLTDSDLDYMRAIVKETLPDKCNILAETLAADGQGGATSSWGTVSTSIACRLDSITQRAEMMQVAGGGQKAAHQFMLSLPYDTAISAGNRVEMGSTTYTVVSVNANQSWMAVGRATLEVI